MLHQHREPAVRLCAGMRTWIQGPVCDPLVMAGNTWDDRMTPRPRVEPRIEHVRTCWTFRGPSGRDITCGVYRVETGIELRVERAGEFLRSQLFRVENAALEHEAATWKQALIAKGFTEIAP